MKIEDLRQMKEDALNNAFPSIDKLCAGYNSPIKLFTKSFGSSIDDGVLNIVQDYGISVNKEELVKALKNDRDQYDKGFKDGKVAGYSMGYDDCIKNIIIILEGMKNHEDEESLEEE